MKSNQTFYVFGGIFSVWKLVQSFENNEVNLYFFFSFRLERFESVSNFSFRKVYSSNVEVWIQNGMQSSNIWMIVWPLSSQMQSRDTCFVEEIQTQSFTIFWFSSRYKLKSSLFFNPFHIFRNLNRVDVKIENLKCNKYLQTENRCEKKNTLGHNWFFFWADLFVIK